MIEIKSLFMIINLFPVFGTQRRVSFALAFAGRIEGQVERNKIKSNFSVF